MIFSIKHNSKLSAPTAQRKNQLNPRAFWFWFFFSSGDGWNDNLTTRLGFQANSTFTVVNFVILQVCPKGKHIHGVLGEKERMNLKTKNPARKKAIKVPSLELKKLPFIYLCYFSTGWYHFHCHCEGVPSSRVVLPRLDPSYY